MAVICSFCGAENQGNKIKCHDCGRLLSEAVAGGLDKDQRAFKVLAGKMKAAELTVDTSDSRVVDLTDHVKSFASGVNDSGLVNLFALHATVGLGIMETGSGSEADLGEVLDRLFPPDHRWQHSHGSEGHGRDHLLPLFLSPSLTLPVDGGRVVLGTWQRVVLVDTNKDNSERRVRFSFAPGSLGKD